MISRALLLPLVFLSLLSTATAGDWPWWRGESRNGVADADQKPPVKFSSTENVLWVAPVPGRGHGSPTVFGDKVFLASADESQQTQSVLCFDRKTGKPIWNKVIHRGGFPPKSNKRSSHASSTVACDGKRIFINFMNRGAVHTTALTLDGNKIWQKKICDYVVHQGFATSPAIYKSLVIVSADNKTGGAVRALKRDTGKYVWKVDRPKFPNYVSPIIFNLAGRDQLLLQGCNLLTSIDPNTGKKIWETKGATTECVSSIVTDGKRVFTSGGYPKNHVAAVTVDGSAKVEWNNNSRVYVPSMVVKDGHLFAVMDNGVAICWNSETGEQKWKERLGRTANGSPILVGELIYFLDESGQFFVFKADPAKFEIVSKNKLGDEVFSTPAICGGEIFVRVAENIDDKRQEKLYCIGGKK